VNGCAAALLSYTPFTRSSKHHANIKQASSNRAHFVHVYFECNHQANVFKIHVHDVCSIARCLLDVCVMFVLSCNRGINYPAVQ